jgi:hypothetical protein
MCDVREDDDQYGGVGDANGAGGGDVLAVPGGWGGCAGDVGREYGPCGGEYGRVDIEWGMGAGECGAGGADEGDPECGSGRGVAVELVDGVRGKEVKSE